MSLIGFYVVCISGDRVRSKPAYAAEIKFCLSMCLCDKCVCGFILQCMNLDVYAWN